MQDREDIFINVWEDVYKALPTLKLKNDLKPWIVGVTKRKVAQYYPKTAKQTEDKSATIEPGTTKSITSSAGLEEMLHFSNEDQPFTLIDSLSADIFSDPAFLSLLNEEKAMLLERALPELQKRSPDGYEIIMHSYFLGLKDKEIAQLLQKNYSAVRTAKYRALRHLEKIIENLLCSEEREKKDWFEYLR